MVGETDEEATDTYLRTHVEKLGGSAQNKVFFAPDGAARFLFNFFFLLDFRQRSSPDHHCNEQDYQTDENKRNLYRGCFFIQIGIQLVGRHGLVLGFAKRFA
ncbi:hypothetical protein D3C87_1507270 [compost metagenome]